MIWIDLFGCVAGVSSLIFILWVRKRQQRLLDADYCFPSLGPVDPPHDFIPMPDIKVCARCGGGSKHKIHTGGPWPPIRTHKTGNPVPNASALNPETQSLVDSAPGSWMGKHNSF